MASTTEGDAVSLIASECFPFVSARGYAPLTDPDAGIWMFYPLKDDVQCFIDVSEHDGDEFQVGFNAIFQPAALPIGGGQIVKDLALEPSFAYAGMTDGLTVHMERSGSVSSFTPSDFATCFQEWDDALLNLVNRIEELRSKRN